MTDTGTSLTRTAISDVGPRWCTATTTDQPRAARRTARRLGIRAIRIRVP
jgi:hypothetical protein